MSECKHNILAFPLIYGFIRACEKCDKSEMEIQLEKENAELIDIVKEITTYREGTQSYMGALDKFYDIMRRKEQEK
jgi:hypothetical protein